MDVKEWGFTNPIVSPLYGKPPLVWKDMRVQLVVYETDIENVPRDPLSAGGALQHRDHLGFEFELGTTQGSFQRVAIYVQVKYEGYEGDYEPFLYVNNPLPLTAAREIWGYQKKMADIGLSSNRRRSSEKYPPGSPDFQSHCGAGVRSRDERDP